MKLAKWFFLLNFLLPMPLQSAFLCCDGKGGFAVCYESEDYSSHPSVLSCIIRHERTHVAQALRHFPNQCNNRLPGEKLFTMTEERMEDIECDAYDVERACLSDQGLLYMAMDLSSLAKKVYECDFTVNGRKSRKERLSHWLDTRPYSSSVER